MLLTSLHPPASSQHGQERLVRWRTTATAAEMKENSSSSSSCDAIMATDESAERTCVCLASGVVTFRLSGIRFGPSDIRLSGVRRCHKHGQPHKIPSVWRPMMWAHNFGAAGDGECQQKQKTMDVHHGVRLRLRHHYHHNHHASATATSRPLPPSSSLPVSNSLSLSDSGRRKR